MMSPPERQVLDLIMEVSAAASEDDLPEGTIVAEAAAVAEDGVISNTVNVVAPLIAQ